MSKQIWLIIASVLLTLGLAVFIGVMSVNDWDFEKLTTTQYERNVYSVNESFDKIDIDVEIIDVYFKLAEDGICKIECDESEEMKCSYTVKDNTLVISVQEKNKWYDFIQFVPKSPKMTLYLPMNEYTALAVESETGDINVSRDFTFSNIEIDSTTADVEFSAKVSETIDIETTTGDVTIKNITANQLNVVTTTGDVELYNVIVEKKMDIETTTGDVEIKDSDAEEIAIETTTGDVSGTLLSDKVFITDTTTGDVDVPKTTTGGKCEITTTTGDIEIDIE